MRMYEIAFVGYKTFTIYQSCNGGIIVVSNSYTLFKFKPQYYYCGLNS